MGKHLYKTGLRKCYSCKQILKLNVENFNKSNKEHKNGFRDECRKCSKKRKKKLPSYKNRNEPFKKYKFNSRKIEFLLKKEQVYKLIKSPCYYCKKQPPNGIDRLNNNKGYIENNVVPCCKTCNFMKSNHSFEDFIQKCKEIAIRF